MDNKICFINKSGEIAIKTEFPYGSGFNDGVAYLWSGDSSAYIKPNGQSIASFSNMGHSNFSDGLASIKDNYNRNYYIDTNGIEVISINKSNLVCHNFSNNFAEVTIPGSDHKTGFIDKKGVIVIPIIYSKVNNFKENLASFYDGEFWGFIDKSGDTLIEPKYDYASDFSNGLCKVEMDGHWGYINHKDELVWKSQENILLEKAELSKWKLDTLENTKNSFLANLKTIGYYNQPILGNRDNSTTLKLKVDTIDITIFNNRHYAYKLYLINGKNDTIQLSTQDGHLKIIKQAKNQENEWIDIEKFYNSFCGNSYYNVKFPPKSHLVFSTPITKGKYKTQLRFKLFQKDTIIYSNEYFGSINTNQFMTENE